MNHWFISHLHGDHCFGLISVISTLGMLHHTGDIFVHAHPDLHPVLQAQLNYFCKDLPFQVHFEGFNPLKNTVIYEDRSLSVSTIPLVHSMPTCGFLFKEKEGQPHLNRELLDFYKVGIEDIKHLKEGADFTTEDGRFPTADLLLHLPLPKVTLTALIPPIQSVSYPSSKELTYYSTNLPLANRKLFAPKKPFTLPPNKQPLLLNWPK